MISIIMPSSFFNLSNIDEDMQDEYDAIFRVKDSNVTVILFEYNAWFNEHRLILHWKGAKASSYGVYRGWMMQPSLYKDFYNELLQNGIRLITSPDVYSLMHLFPNAYKYISADTPKILTYPCHSHIELSDIRKHFSRFIVKDFVKSVKGTEFPDVFDVNEITQVEFDSWIKVFYNYRCELLTGGICIKEYVDLRKYHCNNAEFTNEFRVFYLFGTILAIGENSNQLSKEQCIHSKPPLPLILRYKNLESPFYTIDFAELSTGDWIIIEVGDGGVSGIPVAYSKDIFYKKLIERLKDGTGMVN